MRATRLKNYWKGFDGYCQAYELFTQKYTVEDIINCGKEIVLFGWFPRASGLLSILKECGITVKYVCEINQIPEDADGIPVSDGLILKDYRKLLEDAEKYFFLFFCEDGRVDLYNSGMIKRVRLLQYQGVDEFGIISDVRTRDLYGNDELMECVHDTVNEIFKGAHTYDWEAFALCRTVIAEDIQNWDYPFYWLLNEYKDKPRKSFFEVGPGIGVCSISLKKLLDLDVTWLNVPAEEPGWRAWRKNSAKKLFDKYDIQIKEAFIEMDEIEGYYDIIFLSQVMEHFVFNPIPTIKKLVRHLNDDGVICISVPDIIYNNPKNVESYKDIPFYEELSAKEIARRTVINSYTHYHEYGFEEALELFDECGLECIASHKNYPIYHFILKKKK